MDISMCNNKICAVRETCLRNPASGTVPDPMRQSWIDWEPESAHGCDAYWHVEKKDGNK